MHLNSNKINHINNLSYDNLSKLNVLTMERNLLYGFIAFEQLTSLK